MWTQVRDDPTYAARAPEAILGNTLDLFGSAQRITCRLRSMLDIEAAQHVVPSEDLVDDIDVQSEVGRDLGCCAATGAQDLDTVDLGSSDLPGHGDGRHGLHRDIP